MLYPPRREVSLVEKTYRVRELAEPAGVTVRTLQLALRPFDAVHFTS